MIWFLVIGCLGSSLPESYAQDREFTVGSTRVEFAGRSGQFKFCALDSGATKCDGRHVQIKMDRLREVDANNASVNNEAGSFASQDFTWSAPVEVDVPSGSATVKGTKVNFTANVRVGNGQNASIAKFVMVTIVYQENGTATNGNETIVVPKGALKFTIEIEDWPFLNPNNKLQFGVDIRSKKRDKSDFKPEKGAGNL